MCIWCGAKAVMFLTKYLKTPSNTTNKSIFSGKKQTPTSQAWICLSSQIIQENPFKSLSKGKPTKNHHKKPTSLKGSFKKTCKQTKHQRNSSIKTRLLHSVNTWWWHDADSCSRTRPLRRSPGRCWTWTSPGRRFCWEWGPMEHKKDYP